MRIIYQTQRTVHQIKEQTPSEFILLYKHINIAACPLAVNESSRSVEHVCIMTRLHFRTNEEDKLDKHTISTKLHCYCSL